MSTTGRRLSSTLAICLASGFGVGCQTTCNAVYEGQLSDIRERASAIPGVSVIQVGGSREEFGMDSIYAFMRVADRGTLRVGNVTPESFEAGGSFIIYQVGSQFPAFTSYGYLGARETGREVQSLGFGTGIPVLGQAEDLRELLPVRVERVQDVVEHFREIEIALARWPRCPAFFEHRSHRVCYRLCVATDDRYTISDKPPSFEQCAAG